MSASLIKSPIVTQGSHFFSSKERNRLVTVPVHGTIGWKDTNGEWQQWVYLSNRDYQGWFLMEDYRRQKNAKKEVNRNFYQSHTALLKMKIEQKRKGMRSRLHGCCIGFGT